MSESKQMKQGSVVTTKNFTVVVNWDEQKVHIRPYGVYSAKGCKQEATLPLVNATTCRLRYKLDKETNECTVSVIDTKKDPEGNDDYTEESYISFSHKQSHDCLCHYYDDEDGRYHRVGYQSLLWNSIDDAFYGCEKRMREQIAYGIAARKYALRVENITTPASNMMFINTAEIDGNIWMGFTNNNNENNRRYDGSYNLTFGRMLEDNLGRHETDRMEYHRWLAQFSDEEKVKVKHGLVSLDSADEKACILHVKDHGCAVIASDPVFVESISENPTEQFATMLELIHRYLSVDKRADVTGWGKILHAIGQAFDAVYVQYEHIQLDTSDCNFK